MSTDTGTKHREPSAMKEIFSLAHGVWSLGRRSRKLVIGLNASALSLASFRGRRLEDHARFFLRETPEDALQRSVASFLKGLPAGRQGKRFRDAILLLPRSEVLSKELVLATNGSSLKEALEKKLESLLPYSPKEMAFGFSFEREGEELKGEVLAIPEKNLKETLSFLERLGLHPDEIVTEDQPLLWLLSERKSNGPILLLDRTEERLLALFLEKGRTSFARIFQKKDHPTLRELLPELSFSLLERQAKPEKILLSGIWEKETEEEISRHFNLSSERLNLEGKDGVPSSIHGASLFGKYPLTSLLPREEKLKKWTKERKSLVKGSFLGFLLFLGSLILASFLHLQGLTGEVGKLERKIQTLYPEVKETKEILSFLQVLESSQGSKEKLLVMLKELGTKIPPSIRLKEMRIEGKDFLFKGESPSHGYLSETVQVLEKLPMLEGAKLEQTRLRKRLNEDYFEFEVKARWKP